jgi:hypothetical protein
MLLLLLLPRLLLLLWRLLTDWLRWLLLLGHACCECCHIHLPLNDCCV